MTHVRRVSNNTKIKSVVQRFRSMCYKFVFNRFRHFERSINLPQGSGIWHQQTSPGQRIWHQNRVKWQILLGSQHPSSPLLKTPNHPLKPTNSAKWPQWKFGASWPGDNLTQGLSRTINLRQISFAIERRRSRSTSYESIHTLATHRSQPSQ